MRKNDTKLNIASILTGILAMIFGILFLIVSKNFMINLGAVISIVALGSIIKCIILFIFNLVSMLVSWSIGVCMFFIGYFILKGDI